MADFTVDNIVDFDLEQTLECGQSFHFVKIDEKDYALTAFGHFLRVSQKGSRLIFHNTGREEYYAIWKNYFDLGRDYKKIKCELLSKDNKLREAIETMSGVRIMNQEFSELLMSFIISQNKQIPHIKQIVAELSKQYGQFKGTVNGIDMYAFPTIEEMSAITEQDYRDCKTGFRAPYLLDAASKLSQNILDENVLRSISPEECEKQLCQIKGVGSKVANCVMLFALGHRSAFPVDVWIKRIMEVLYYEGRDTPKERISAFAREQFGCLGGYAQQYLFYYGKTMKVGAKRTISSEAVNNKIIK
ncbi:MAG: DNA glycosylase [Eubacteriales bacterium]|nr:DNA glycosylase [Eubacteriales bacterium]